MTKKTQRIIQAINDSVPKELRDAVLTQEYIAPDLRLLARKTVVELREEAEAMEPGKERDKALREVQRLQNVIDAGYYDEKEWRVNKEAADKVEAWIDAELDKAIKEGRIPHPKNDREYQNYQRKLKQHERRNQKSTIGRIAKGARGENGSSEAS